MWPTSMVALTILDEGRQHSGGYCNNLHRAGIHTFYFYGLQLILHVYPVCWKKVLQSLHSKVRRLSRLYPPHSKQEPEMCSNGLQMHLINTFIACESCPGETEDTTS